MVDFHSHILPGVDDGARNMTESLSMLRSSFLQGVDVVVSTSHFYANEEYPEAFLKRRDAAAETLMEAMLFSEDIYPEVILGAEVLYFPGISDAEGIDQLRIGDSSCILIEPPMAPWSDDMLDEIRQLGRNYGLTPIIAHVDRYMSMLKDNSLLDRVWNRELIAQVNGAYFLNPKTRDAALRNLKTGKIKLLGSDCHNMDSRSPNLGAVRKLTTMEKMQTEFNQLCQNAMELLINRSI